MKNVSVGFASADILLPDFSKIDGRRWACVACDQFTSEPNYWKAVEKEIGDAPSTLSMILPEAFLKEADERLPKINREMAKMCRGVLVNHPDSLIYLERTQSDGRLRKGLIGAVDLDAYDYRKESKSLIRATEGTVLDRIPPRVAIRRDAPIELPHVMLLIDDPQKSVIEPLKDRTDAPIYDFDLMQGGGHVRGFCLSEQEKTQVFASLSDLISPAQMKARYGSEKLPPLLFAVGDGNHSLAAAKASYEELKAQIGEEAAKVHPARYALAEVVNLHDEALEFEPIYRVVYGADRQELLSSLKAYAKSLSGSVPAQKVTVLAEGSEESVVFEHPVGQLTVGTLQTFLDGYGKEHPGVTVDYIHNEDSLRALAKEPNAVGFLFDGMQKEELFRTVLFDGALPRKTFSMGHAQDKRYYLECRKIK